MGGRGDRPSQASSCLTDGPLRRPESSLAGGWGAPEPLKCPGPWSPSADTLSPSYTLAGTSLRWPQSGRGGGGPGEAAEAPPGWARGPQMESRRPVPRARRSRRRPGPHSDYSAFPLSGRPLMAGWAGRGRKCRLPGPLTRLERRPRPRQPPAPAAHCSTAVLGTSDLWGGGLAHPPACTGGRKESQRQEAGLTDPSMHQAPQHPTTASQAQRLGGGGRKPEQHPRHSRPSPTPSYVIRNADSSCRRGPSDRAWDAEHQSPG